MSTPHMTRRSARKAAQTSLIPRPRWGEDEKDAHTKGVGDSASPALPQGKKRRHVSEPDHGKKQKDVPLRSPLQKRKHDNILQQSPRRSPRCHSQSSAVNLNVTVTISQDESETENNSFQHSKRRRRSSSHETVLTSNSKIKHSTEENSVQSLGSVRKKAKKSPVSKETVVKSERSPSARSPGVTSHKTDDGRRRRSKDKTPPHPQIDEDDDDILDACVSTPRRHNSGPDRRKSKRRSSFVRGRISKVVPLVSDVSLDIPSDLPDEERLQKLETAVVKYTLGKLEEEMADLQGLQQFQVEVRDAVEQSSHSQGAKELYKQATCTNRFLPNPQNETLSTQIADLISYTERLKKESERWRELFKLREEETAKAKEVLKEIQENPLTEQPAVGFTPQELSFLANRPDYNGLLSDLHTQRECCKLSVNSLLQVTNALKLFQETSNTLLAEQAQLIYQETFGNIEDFDRPDKLLASVIEFKELQNP